MPPTNQPNAQNNPIHSTTIETHQTLTYEQATANNTLQQSPDPIHWNPTYSFRKQPYRHLYHQKSIIGHFTVRLVEAKGLKRSHWSLLGMGVVRHLGLSNAHGEVSSFANLKLGYRFRNDDSFDFENDNENDGESDGEYENEMMRGRQHHHHQQQYMHHVQNDKFNQYNWQNGNIASAVATSSSLSLSSSSNSNHQNPSKHNNRHNNNNMNNIIFTNHESHKSSTVQSNSNPKWPSVQTNTNTSVFHIPLTKGSMPQDGMEIILSIQMKEEKSAVDSIVPIGTGGSGNGSNDGLLGVGLINLTGLVMQGLTNNKNGCGGMNSTGDEHKDSGIVDVYDEWITLTNYDENRDEASNSNKNNNSSSNNNISSSSNGQVRLLISYEPNGLQPQKNDIIAFESFARRSSAYSNCPTVIPPLHPLKVKDVKGEYVLAEFDLSPVLLSNGSNHSAGNQYYNSNDEYDNDDHNSYNKNNNNDRMKQNGCIRLHRNTIFVIERTNLVDSAIDLSLKPTDLLMSTELGQNVSNAAQPYVEAAGDLLAPVLLSSKLLVEAGKVGGGALAIGLKSAVVSVVENSDPERRRKAKRSSTTSSASPSVYEHH